MGSNNMAQQMLNIINKSSESRKTDSNSKELQQKQNNQTLESLSVKKSEKKGSPKRENTKKKLDGCRFLNISKVKDAHPVAAGG